MRPRKPKIRGDEAWIEVNGLLEVCRASAGRFVPRTFTESASIVAALKVRLQSFGIHRAKTSGARLIVRRDACLDLVGDVAGHVSFEQKDVLHVTLVTVGP